MKRRMVGQREFVSFLRNKCKPTPFAFSVLTNNNQGLSSSATLSVCIPCVNWKRRILACPIQRRDLPMLQIDQLVYYLIRPGFFMEPDRRCIGRLLAGVRQQGNPFLSIFPLPVLSILSKITENTYDACVSAWWDYNGRTEFFGSGAEAKRVRLLLNRMGDS